MSIIFYIYALLDSRPEQYLRPRYVGQTTQALKNRLKQHLSDLRSTNQHKNNWIKAHTKLGLKPKIVLLEACVSQEELNEAEKNGSAKITYSIADTIRALYIPRKFSTRKLAKQFGLSQSVVHKIVTNKLWVK